MLIFTILQEGEGRILDKLYEIYYIGKADFLDRIRNKNIYIIMLIMMYISYLFFPENISSIYYTLIYSSSGFMFRGIYNSVWLGWVAAVAFVSVITLIGFYFVRNSIMREREFLVSEITAATKVESWIFIFGKAFGNVLFLLLQMIAVILVTIIMQFVRGESYVVQPIKLLIPFLILAVPACVIVSVIAILFEIIPILRGSFGNVVYFFAWAFLCAVSFSGNGAAFSDVFGMSSAINVISKQVHFNFKQLNDIQFSFGMNGSLHGNIKTFVMDNVNIGVNFLIGRLFWIALGILLLFIASIFFKKPSLLKANVSTKTKGVKPIEQKGDYYRKEVCLSQIFEAKAYSNNLSIIKSEIKIMLSSAKLWWFGAIILCSVGILFSKGDDLYKGFIPLLWILPMFIWSKLGTLQANYNVEDYLLTYVNYRENQLINSIIAAILFTIVINTSLIIKLILLKNFVGAVYILTGSLFVNSIAMFIGNITKSSTAFEIVYIVLWYVGILNSVVSLDFLGLTKAATRGYIPIAFFAVGVGLLTVSIIIKNSRIKAFKN